MLRLLIAMLLVAGCGPDESGKAARKSFEEWMRTPPEDDERDAWASARMAVANEAVFATLPEHVTMAF